jgi:hypothetical protein
MYHSPLPAHFHIVTIDGGYCIVLDPERRDLSHKVQLINSIFLIFL